jgi:superfamily II RNA helicase
MTLYSAIVDFDPEIYDKEEKRGNNTFCSKLGAKMFEGDQRYDTFRDDVLSITGTKMLHRIINELCNEIDEMEKQTDSLIEGFKTLQCLTEYSEKKREIVVKENIDILGVNTIVFMVLFISLFFNYLTFWGFIFGVC